MIIGDGLARTNACTQTFNQNLEGKIKMSKNVEQILCQQGIHNNQINDE